MQLQFDDYITTTNASFNVGAFLTNKTYSYCYIGKSWWTVDPYTTGSAATCFDPPA